jgi:hypothetical protein
MHFSHLHRHKNPNILREHHVVTVGHAGGMHFLHLGIDHLREIQAKTHSFLCPFYALFSLGHFATIAPMQYFRTIMV